MRKIDMIVVHSSGSRCWRYRNGNRKNHPPICGLGDLQFPQPIDMLIRRYGLDEISF